MYYAVNKHTKAHRIVCHDDPISDNEDLVLADNGGWIEWHGGKCPLPDDTCHQIKYSRYVFDDNRPQTWGWGDSDLTHYRPIIEEKEQDVTSNTKE